MAKNTVTLSAIEISALTMAATRENVLPLSFGPHGCVLDMDEAKWTIPLLAELRGITAPAT